MLEFKQVTKSFKDGNRTIEAVKDTTITFNKGEVIGVVGPSGSGKSTFLTMAGALQTPSSGEISINGKKITHMKQPELAKVRMNEIGFVLQATNLVPFDSEATICSVKKQKSMYLLSKTFKIY